MRSEGTIKRKLLSFKKKKLVIKDKNLIDNLKLSDTKTILSSYAIPLRESQVMVALKVLTMLRELKMVGFCLLLNTP